MSASISYQLQLRGTPRLLAPDGRDVTPRLKKTVALLAYLALAEGKPVGRAVLQDLLWSDREPEQGRDSLKKAIAELRAAFSLISPCPIETNRGPVALNLSRVQVDIFESSVSDSGLFRPEFLAGLDIRDNQFNTWLREMRSLLRERQGAIRDARFSVHSESVALEPAISTLFDIAILPIHVSETDAPLAGVANTMIDSILFLFNQSSVVRCFDLRLQRVSPQGVREADVIMQLHANRFGGTFAFGIQLRHIVSGQVIWFSNVSVGCDQIEHRWIERWSASVFDQSCARLYRFERFSENDHRAARLVFGAVDQIVRLTNADLEAAGNALDEAADLAASSTIFAWNAFLTAFRAEKKAGVRDRSLIERAQFLSRRALELDKHNLLTIALVAHVYSFVLRDMNSAAEILAPVRDHAGSTPLLADTLSMLEFYSGNYENAFAYAVQAAETGKFNPFRYSFTTSVAMSSLMLGRPDHAMRACKMALAQHQFRNGHFYEPTLRTLAAASGLVGAREEGRAAIASLERQGGYSVREWIREEGMLYPNSDVQNYVRKGMERLYV